MCFAFFIAAHANYLQTAQMLQKNSDIEVLILRLKRRLKDEGHDILSKIISN
jgi:hypothetical protein